VAVAIVAASFANGSYGGVATGIGTAVVWAAVVCVVMSRRPTGPLSRSFVAAIAALAAIALISALSLRWSADAGSGFTDVVRSSGYLGVFVLIGLLAGPGTGRSALTGIGGGLVAVCLIAIGSRLLALGPGDADLVATFPSSAGRLSYPTGYWNALGAMAAMAVPVLVWLATEARRRALLGFVLAGFVPVLLVAYMTSSRGALIAAALGSVLVIAATPERGRALAGVLVGVVAALPAVIVAAAAAGIVDSPGTAVGRPELEVCAAMVIGFAIAAAAGPPVLERLGGIRLRGVRLRYVLVSSVALLAVLVVLVGPGRIAGDFAAKSGREAAPTGGTGVRLSVSGSGRAQFWGSALDAFASAPVKGIGTGSFPTYWNQHGGLETPVQNAHSEPLELLAEVGPLGFLAFFTFFGVVAGTGIRRARGSDGAPAGAGLGVVATGLVGLLIDWTWDVPSVMIPLLAAAALICARALDPVGAPAERSGRPERRFFARRPIRVPAPVLALVAIAFAIPAVGAGLALAATTNRLQSSDDELARGQLDAAAADARSAAAIVPWSSTPWLKLATIELAAGNARAARTVVGRAIDLAPDDFRLWLLAAQIESSLGNNEVVGAYMKRALELAPLVLPRLLIEPNLGLGNLP
jgi:hypothetical protein